MIQKLILLILVSSLAFIISKYKIIDFHSSTLMAILIIFTFFNILYYKLSIKLQLKKSFKSLYLSNTVILNFLLPISIYKNRPYPQLIILLVLSILLNNIVLYFFVKKTSTENSID